MTEPAVASSDASNIATEIREESERHRTHTMIAVPLDTPGVNILRSTSVFGFSDGSHGGHAEIGYHEVWVPRENLLGEPHGGFAIAQARLGPGRIHHAMRLIGMAERAFDLVCERAKVRFPFGKPIAEQGVFQIGSPRRASASSRSGCWCSRRRG